MNARNPYQDGWPFPGTAKKFCTVLGHPGSPFLPQKCPWNLAIQTHILTASS